MTIELDLAAASESVENDDDELVTMPLYRS